MKVYRLAISSDESEGEGEDHDEYFASLISAMQRRKELIEIVGGTPRGYADYEIECLTIAQLPLKKLILSVLNRKGFVAHRELVVEAYDPDEDEDEEEDYGD